MTDFVVPSDDFAPERPASEAERIGEDVPDVAARCFKRRALRAYRRAFSEVTLLDVMPYELEDGMDYHVLSGGNVDSLSFIKHILRLQNLDYLLFSTWCMAMEDVEQIGAWAQSGKIRRLDAYVGEIFTGSYAAEHRALLPIVQKTGGRVCIFRNHAKVYAGCGPKFAFGVESSANINTNPRTENTTLSVGRDIFEFYKGFFDGIKSFQRDFDDWKPWSA